jgi:hypothetical protein
MSGSDNSGLISPPLPRHVSTPPRAFAQTMLAQVQEHRNKHQQGQSISTTSNGADGVDGGSFQDTSVSSVTDSKAEEVVQPTEEVSLPGTEYSATKQPPSSTGGNNQNKVRFAFSSFGTSKGSSVVPLTFNLSCERIIIIPGR